MRSVCFQWMVKHQWNISTRNSDRKWKGRNKSDSFINWKLKSKCVYMIDFSSCPESTRPDQTRSCILPCKVNCIVTPFSEWSPCASSCSPSKYRHVLYLLVSNGYLVWLLSEPLFSVITTIRTQSRHRIIIQRPASGGQECPATLYEERECDPQPLCPTYRCSLQSRAEINPVYKAQMK